MDWSIRRKPGSADASITASAEGAGTRGRLLPINRLEAFSDGVFAIAITLLVLELHVPTGQEVLVKGLEHDGPRYLGYFVSFSFIGGAWIAHSSLTRFIKAASRLPLPCDYPTPVQLFSHLAWHNRHGSQVLLDLG
jgi:Endosomal/lysosomal potassium channel TMEM175